MFQFIVEKKEPFQFEADKILHEVRDYLKIHKVTRVRVFQGYEIDGIAPSVFQEARCTIFSDPVVEDGYDTLPQTNADFVLSIAPVPSQYNQRADMAQQLLQLLAPQSTPVVHTFQTIAFFGSLSEKDHSILQSYYINPVEMRLHVPLSAGNPQTPKPIVSIQNFSQMTTEQLQQLKKEYILGMSVDNLLYCQTYYQKENKTPTITELKILDAYWSDHCRHSTFLTQLHPITIEPCANNNALLQTIPLFEQTYTEVYGKSAEGIRLMDIATLEMKKLKKQGKLEDLEESDEINACTIEVQDQIDGKDETFLIMFKNETHNHPTEIEPFGGASTCIGGGIRDPLSGRAFVFGGVRVTGAGDPRESYADTRKGKLPQRKIDQVAAMGFSSYANQIGLASGQLLAFYDEGFKAKRMECGGLVAYAMKKDIQRGKPICGDVVILVGGRTGRDGIGGATGSSQKQDQQGFDQFASEVQKGNPLIERNIVRLFRNPMATKIIKKCNDFGAGGVSVAVGELADSLHIHLDAVPLKYAGLDATEIATSESQERMAILVDQKDVALFLSLAAAENLEAVPVAEVTADNRIRMDWCGQEVANLDSAFLNSGGVQLQSAVEVKRISKDTVEEPQNIQQKWMEILGELNICSKQPIANGFDTTANNVSVLLPFGGEKQRTPEQGLAMKVPLLKGESKLGVLMTVGYDPANCWKSPFHAAMLAVIESVGKIVAMGGDYQKVRLSFQEYFESTAGQPEAFGKVYAALMGAFLAQDRLAVPSVGGKDSMSGTFQEIHVPPSLLSFAVATVQVDKVVSRAFKKPGSFIYLVETVIDENGVPDFEQLKQNYTNIYEWIQEGIVLSASVVGAGGIAATVSEMSFGNEIGVSLAHVPSNLLEARYTDLLLETTCEIEGATLLGNTIKEKKWVVGQVQLDVQEALAAWSSPLTAVFPLAPRTKPKPIQDATPLQQKNTIACATSKNKTPKVLIPIFPGTIGEYELEKQFVAAGAAVTPMLFRNRTPKDIEESFEQLAHQISQSDVLVLPSGMSAGAEPDGGAKMISLIFKEPRIQEQCNLLLQKKGLVLGIGEGFKALIQLGLIQHGYVDTSNTPDIAFTKNTLGQYNAQLVRVKITNPVFPWFQCAKDTVEILPVSSAEGRIYMTAESYQSYAQKGQIVSQYVDLQGNTTMDERYNPFGASYGIEGMVSENGQVFGRVGLSERVEKGLYQNVTSIQPSPLFRNMVSYFQI